MSEAGMPSKFSGTMPVAERYRFNVAALETWMQHRVEGFAGPLRVDQFRGGQSNPSFRLSTPGHCYVMRSKPGPVAKLLPSAHAIEREYRVLAALAGSKVPVPRVLGLCEDESVIGRAFYVMEYVEGEVHWDQGLCEMTPAQRRSIYLAMNQTIAALHRIDPAQVGLADYGKPGNYFARQINRWTRQYLSSETEPIVSMHQLIAWLPNNIPPGEESCLVHGDFRLDNLIFAPLATPAAGAASGHSTPAAGESDHAPTAARVCAVLDWELSTLGHPLADFSYHCMSWHIPPGIFRGIAGLDLAALGIPEESEYLALYCAQTQREAGALMQYWNFYLAYNMFRLAGILQGIMKRVVEGTAASDEARESGERARPMADMGWEMACRIP
jgi:aminoglycoside phosphotransferase (APT) family kinase protein